MIQFGYPREVRLVSAGEYRRVFEQAQFRAPHPYFLVLAVSQDQERARLGLVVAKKNVRKAVDRNRIKRLIRESFRLRLPELPPLDLVVLVRREAASASNRELLDVLDKLWSRLTRQYLAQAAKEEASPP